MVICDTLIIIQPIQLTRKIKQRATFANQMFRGSPVSNIRVLQGIYAKIAILAKF